MGGNYDNELRTEIWYILPQRRHSTYRLIIAKLSRLPSPHSLLDWIALLFCRCSIRPDGNNSAVSSEGDAKQLKSGTLLSLSFMVCSFLNCRKHGSVSKCSFIRV